MKLLYSLCPITKNNTLYFFVFFSFTNTWLSQFSKMQSSIAAGKKKRFSSRISSTWPTGWIYLQLRSLFQTEADTQITVVFSTLPDVHLHCFIYNNRLGSSDYILNYMDTRKELTISLGQGVPC